MKHCIQCGQEYTPSPRAPKSFYCGNACKQANYRDRQKQRKQDEQNTLDSSLRRYLEKFGLPEESIKSFQVFQQIHGIRAIEDIQGLLTIFEIHLRNRKRA